MNELLARNLDRIVRAITARRIKACFPGGISFRGKPGPPPRSQEIAQLYSPPSEPPLIRWANQVDKPHSRIRDFRFATPLPSPYPENNTVYGRYFQTKRGNHPPIVILLHGWMMEYDILYRYICLSLNRSGLDSLLFELPFHKRRASRGTFSGAYFMLQDIPSTFQALRQSVAETRSLINWFKKNLPLRSIGILGLSLGGWIGGMLTVLEPRLSFSILAAPAAEPAGLLRESFLGGIIYRNQKAQNLTQKELEEITRVATPSRFPPAIAADRVLLIENLYDSFIPPRVIEKLKQAWGNTEFKQYPHGHISILFSRGFKRDIAEFAKRKSGFDPEV